MSAITAVPVPSPTRVNGNSNTSVPSPSSALLNLDPLKERKLEERLSRAPGVHSQIGFDSSYNERTISSAPSLPGNSNYEEGSRGMSVTNAKATAAAAAALAAKEIPEDPTEREGSSSHSNIEPVPLPPKRISTSRTLSINDYFGGGDSSNSRKANESSKRARNEDGPDNYNKLKDQRRAGPNPQKSPRPQDSSKNIDRSPRAIRGIDSEVGGNDEETLRLVAGEDDGEEEEEDADGAMNGESPEKNNEKLKKGRFTPEEDECLLAKQKEFGSNWKLLSQNGGEILAGRTPNALSRRFTTLTKRVSSAALSNSAILPQPSRPSASAAEEEDDDEVLIVEPSGGVTSAVLPPNQPQIHQFFKPVHGSSLNSSSSSAAASSGVSTTSNLNSGTTSSSFSHGSSKRVRPVSPGSTISSLNAQHQAELQKVTLELEKARREKHDAENLLVTTSKEFDRSMEEMRQRQARASELVQNMLRVADKAEAARARKVLSENSFNLGCLTVMRSGVGPHAHPRETWKDGYMKEELQVRSNQLLQQKNELDRQQKQMRTGRRGRNNATTTQDQQLEMELEERALEEVRAQRLAKLKQEEGQLAEDRNRYQVEKQLHMRELKRIRDEDNSKYWEKPVLDNRYLLRSMLGKGGFSEVWKAFDLLAMRDVAIKIHELDPSWTEDRRMNYSKHAKREYKIHLAVKHPRIVQLYDVIEINNSRSFATVLEYCPGTDLDAYLKRNKFLPEKEAKSILMQILSALLCLSSGGGVKDSSSIIHYDIKPANILFDAEGGIKLTDFGLSKIVSGEQEDTIPGVELTSQGAGTYWYLPPECFNFDRNNPPKISNKVDVWSTGVVFYQMLFGQRPFGEGMSQETMLKAETVLRATKVDFPVKPAVSDAAKDFIRRCLTHSQQLRPDVETICQDPYLRPAKKKAPAPPASSTSTSMPSMALMPPPPNDYFG